MGDPFNIFPNLLTRVPARFVGIEEGPRKRHQPKMLMRVLPGLPVRTNFSDSEQSSVSSQTESTQVADIIDPSAIRVRLNNTQESVEETVPDRVVIQELDTSYQGDDEEEEPSVFSTSHDAVPAVAQPQPESAPTSFQFATTAPFPIFQPVGRPRHPVPIMARPPLLAPSIATGQDVQTLAHMSQVVNSLSLQVAKSQVDQGVGQACYGELAAELVECKREIEQLKAERRGEEQAPVVMNPAPQLQEPPLDWTNDAPVGPFGTSVQGNAGSVHGDSSDEDMESESSGVSQSAVEEEEKSVDLHAATPVQGDGKDGPEIELSDGPDEQAADTANENTVLP
ncbi:MAG: hypothetical protein GY696_22265 [Gammaproteobacteria bacterium]|nr:hypothetical protein [Gammaproteobacteria bacterium]